MPQRTSIMVQIQLLRGEFHSVSFWRLDFPSELSLHGTIRKELKLQKREMLSKTKKNFTLIQDAISLWEKLRPKTTSEDQKKELVTRIMDSLHGKVSELVNQHTASRIIQFCLKNGSEEQRASIWSEVKSQILELSKSKHGHHLVQRLIAISKKEDLSGESHQSGGEGGGWRG
jgi:hypothetical protein